MPLYLQELLHNNLRIFSQAAAACEEFALQKKNSEENPAENQQNVVNFLTILVVWHVVVV